LKAGRLVVPFSLRLPASDNVFLMHAPGLAPGSPAALFRDWLLRKSSAARSKISVGRPSFRSSDR